MVRRLKSDLRHFGETFPERKVDPIYISNLPSDTPELVLSRMLAAYGEAVRARAANLPPKEGGYVRLAFVGLQQRLLSSIAAFANFPGGFGQPWQVITITPIDDFVGTLKKTNRLMMVVIIGLTMVELFFIYFASRRLSRPVNAWSA